MMNWAGLRRQFGLSDRLCQNSVRGHMCLGGGDRPMRRFDVVWLLFWGILSSAWCLSAAPKLSATFDEPYHVHSGLDSWRTGSNREHLKAGRAPLPIDVEFLPIYIWDQFRDEPFD